MKIKYLTLIVLIILFGCNKVDKYDFFFNQNVDKFQKCHDFDLINIRGVSLKNAKDNEKYIQYLKQDSLLFIRITNKNKEHKNLFFIKKDNLYFLKEKRLGSFAYYFIENGILNMYSYSLLEDGEKIVDTSSVFIKQMNKNKYIECLLSKNEFKKEVYGRQNINWSECDACKSNLYVKSTTKFFNEYTYMKVMTKKTIFYHKVKTTFNCPLIYLGFVHMFHFNPLVDYVEISREEFDNIPE